MLSSSVSTFVPSGHIVRKIWSEDECILFLFAASAAEFAAHRTVDWLYFTGKIPNDPIGRMFSTLEYARKIVFSEREEAEKALAMIRQIHGKVELARGKRIPDWAYRDVLFMLIDNSIRAYEAIHQKLCYSDKQDILDVFLCIGRRLEIPDLPEDYIRFERVRQIELHRNLVPSPLTIDLFAQYRKHLGCLRYPLLLFIQKKLCHPVVKEKLHFGLTWGQEGLWKIFQLIRYIPGYPKLKYWLIPEPHRFTLKHGIRPAQAVSTTDTNKFRRCPVSRKNVH